jgi:catechol 2,3-dioxygenase-like lactoylglutathione lyase family enzyme
VVERVVVAPPDADLVAVGVLDDPELVPFEKSATRGLRRNKRAQAAGAEIVYLITDAHWGLRRFFVRDPNGAAINVTQHE